MSETDKHRHLFIKYTRGDGLDLGSGGDPINLTAISIDLLRPYNLVGTSPIHLRGDATNLHWFQDKVFDYVYSSHLLEDFEDTRKILLEWFRVLKPRGYLCLLFPDERRYRSIEKLELLNLSHKYSNMGLSFIIAIIDTIPNIQIIEAKELFENKDYNCYAIIQKLA